MRFSTAVVLAISAAAARASTLGLGARQLSSCSPSFQGHPVSILYAGTAGLEELTPASHIATADVTTQSVNALSAEWSIENSGLFPMSYLIKDQADHSLVAYAFNVPRDSTVLKLQTIDHSNLDSRQFWRISCTACASTSTEVPQGGVFGTGCQIATVALGTLCLTQTGTVGEGPGFAPCVTGQPNQLYNLRREFL